MSSQNVEKKIHLLEKRLAKTLDHQEAFAEWEERTEKIVEEKISELKSVAYLLLLISTALFALVLGMVLNALGLKF